jgi:hypothetical protein
MKEAIVYKDRSGYWKVEECDTGRQIGNLCASELEAYKLANASGYIVR